MGVPGEDGGPGVFHLCSYIISNVGGHADFCSVDLQTHRCVCGQSHIEGSGGEDVESAVRGEHL